jgi:hypothetical protein
MTTTSRLVVAFALAILAAMSAAAERPPIVVDGEKWLASSPEIRKAFLIGAGNMMALETAYSKRHGTPPPPAGAMTAKAVDGMTLDQISDRVTRWYEANPQRRHTPVMGVIWIDIVRPVAKPK